MSYTKEQRRAYEKERYYRRKAHYATELGGVCVKCGSVEALEFDHIDPTTKRFTITLSLSTRSAAVLEKELAKCQLLCAKCHREKKRTKGASPNSEVVHTPVPQDGAPCFF